MKNLRSLRIVRNLGIARSRENEKNGRSELKNAKKVSNSRDLFLSFTVNAGIFFSFVSLCTSCSIAPTTSDIERKPSSLLDFGEVVRINSRNKEICAPGENGEPCLANWSDAIAHCKSRQSHVPAAKEFAAHLKKFGVLVRQQFGSSDPLPKGFYLVSSINEDGSSDQLLLNHDNYQRPENENQNLKFWTSSSVPGHTEYAHVVYQALGGGGGDPKEHKKATNQHAFQCLPGLQVPKY